MDKVEISRDRLIFFIFLSILLHFLFYSFYFISNNKTDTPLFEIVESFQGANKDELKLIENNSKNSDESFRDFDEQYSESIQKHSANKNKITFTSKNITPSYISEAQSPKSLRRHTVSAETKDPIYAEYVEEWRRRVEIIGNLYYPQDLALKDISGDLLLDAAIDREGKVKGIKILRTSGNPVLDNAAINIVKLASPFSPLPEKITAETDILHITRTWKFSNKK